MNLFRIGFLLTGLAAALHAPLRADLNSDLAFSAFSNVDVDGLADGKILQSKGGLISFSRGIITQSLYMIDAPPAQVQSKLIQWNPASHPELEVWAHQQLPLNPTPADFACLGSLPDNSSVESLIKATAGYTVENPTVQVNQEEGHWLAAQAAQGGDPKTLFANAWSQILPGRIARFLSGRGATDPYVVSGGDIQPVDEIRSLIHSDARVYSQYQRFFNETPLKTGSGVTAKINPVSLYIDCFDIEGSGALGTGAVYQVAVGPSIQSADFEYFINSGIYATVELEQLWPVNVGGKNETLVWREDLVSAPNVAYLHGTERLASGMIMLQDVKQAINAFRAEFK